jgi:hypothetical protein
LYYTLLGNHYTDVDNAKASGHYEKALALTGSGANISLKLTTSNSKGVEQALLMANFTIYCPSEALANASSFFNCNAM